MWRNIPGKWFLILLGLLLVVGLGGTTRPGAAQASNLCTQSHIPPTPLNPNRTHPPRNVRARSAMPTAKRSAPAPP
ncbi:MAG: hypothetical protein KDE29_20055, partial [Anaerolineales bacterium]|nr:hypothetical protein [Anaerolineales bacterium]